MATASYKAKCQVCATEGGTYYDVAGIEDFSINPSGDLIETTSFSQTAGADDYAACVCRIAGLQDCDAEMSGAYVPTDTNGQAIILARCPGGASWGSTLWVKIIPTGTTGQGFRFEAYPTASHKGTTKGKAEVTYKFTATSKSMADNAA